MLASAFSLKTNSPSSKSPLPPPQPLPCADLSHTASKLSTLIFHHVIIAIRKTNPEKKKSELKTAGTIWEGEVEKCLNRLSESAQKVQNALNHHGVTCEVIELPDSTRTAQEAAQAIGCRVEQIAKSLVFQGKTTNRPILVVASGVHRVNEKKLRDLLSEPVKKADADFVREHTGFAIGGIPPPAIPSPWRPSSMKIFSNMERSGLRQAHPTRSLSSPQRTFSRSHKEKW